MGKYLHNERYNYHFPVLFHFEDSRGNTDRHGLWERVLDFIEVRDLHSNLEDGVY